MKTGLTEMLGIEHPILCAGMGFVAVPQLVAAVSEAGGLGLLATALARGGPALASRLKRGLALYDRLILDEIGQRPDLPHLRGASTGIQALRLHTQHLLESGDARYLALILERHS